MYIYIFLRRTCIYIYIIYTVTYLYIYIHKVTHLKNPSPVTPKFFLWLFVLHRRPSPRPTFQALEALKVAWPLGGQDDGELEERLQRSCRGLEDFTFEAINTSPVEAWERKAFSGGGDMVVVFGGLGSIFGVTLTKMV